jgi:hypothetical protein
MPRDIRNCAERRRVVLDLVEQSIGYLDTAGSMNFHNQIDFDTHTRLCINATSTLTTLLTTRTRSDSKI